MMMPNNMMNDTTIAWANVVILITSSILFTILYVKSVQPAALEQTSTGVNAYETCAWYRSLSGVFMCVACCNYFLYYYYPLAVIHDKWNIPQTFAWPYYISVVLATIIAIPSTWLLGTGMSNAGEETMTPKKDHELYSGGIYDHMRHPQAVGECALWWTVALCLHSPLLCLWSGAVYVPVWYYFCLAEEKDLVVRYGNNSAAYEEYRSRVGWFPNFQQLWCSSETSIHKKKL